MSHYEDRKEENKARKKAVRDTARAEKSAMAKMSRSQQQIRLAELKTEFLTHSSLDRYVRKLFDIALDDDHSGQLGAIKIIADRILPTASFSGESKANNAVQINISGLQISGVEEKEVPPVSLQ
tara:strand:+ start:43 stop:414 length:372 start_codon:yes stop_codon:yes gene_type:complete